MRRIIYAALLPLALATTAQADTLELKLNDSMAEFTYGTAVGGAQGPDVGVGFMFNTDSDLAGIVSLQTVGQMDDAISFAIGMKGFGIRADEPSENLLSFAVGGGVGYTFPGTPLTASLSGYIAPEILTFGDASGVREWTARLQAQLLVNAAVFIGWRELRVRLDEGPDYKLDDEFHFGMKLAF